MDGSARPAGELAAVAGLGLPATSEHLAVLLDAGLLVREAAGRQRYYRIADQSVAGGLEQIGRLCPETAVRSLRQSRQQLDLRQARLCYDHLAGRLGVAVTDAAVRRNWVTDRDLDLTADGTTAFADLGVDLGPLRAARRRVTRPCLDWTERRPHLAGSLGAALARVFDQRGWTRHRPTGRGLRITADGLAALGRHFAITAAELA